MALLKIYNFSMLRPFFQVKYIIFECLSNHDHFRFIEPISKYIFWYPLKGSGSKYRKLSIKENQWL